MKTTVICDSKVLMYAAKKGHEGMVRLLIEYGVDVNAIDDYGNTALTYAYESENDDIIELLLEAGAKSHP